MKGGEERLGVCRAAMTSLEGGADTVQQREPVSGSRNHGHIGLFSVRKNDPEIILVVGMNGSERVVECYIIGSLGSASYDTTPRSPTITVHRDLARFGARTHTH